MSKFQKTNNTRLGDDVEQRELSHTAGEGVQPRWKTSSASSYKLNIHIPCDPKIPLVGITQGK